MSTIISQEHDVQNIRIELTDVDQAMNNLMGQSRVWDAAEYGITREEAERRMRAADTPEARGRVVAELRQRAIDRANLATIGDKVSFAGVGDTWHGLGVKVDKAMTSIEAIKFASMDNVIEKYQTFVEIDGKKVEVPNLFAVGYQDGERPVVFDGVGVHSKYEIIQNEVSFKFMDDVLGGLGAHYDTVGSIEGGRKIWISAIMPRHAEPIRGDVVQNYLLATNSHDRTESFWIYSTDVRTVCANTRRQSIVDRAKGIKIRHTGEIRYKINEAKKAVGLAATAFDRYVEVADAMCRFKVDPKRFVAAVLDSCLAVGAISSQEAVKGADALVAALPLNDSERKEAIGRIQRLINRREVVVTDILNRYESDTNTAPGLLWGAFQSVTEYANHAMKYRGNSRKQSETRFGSIVTGRADELNQIAYDQALSFLAS